MGNYPAGSDTANAPWNASDANGDVLEASCSICQRFCVSNDDGCTWRDDATTALLDGEKTPNGLFVCSKACSSQAMYEAATPEEQGALRLLARWNESAPILQNAFLKLNPYQKQLDVKHLSVWERWNNAYDILKLCRLLEKIGADLTGAEEAPEWYTQAITPAPERRPVQSVRGPVAPPHTKAG